MEPKCSCGADSNLLTSKRQYISSLRYIRIIYCSTCGKIHGILEDKDIYKEIEKLEKKIR